MTILKRLIDLVDKFQIDNNIESELIVRELQNTLNHFKLRDIHLKQDKFEADYVEKPWF